MSGQAEQKALLDLADSVLVPAYRRPNFVLRRGQGVELWDVSGQRYLDMVAGMAVCVLGHAHPAIASALSKQADQLVHASNLYHMEQQILAAQAIVARCFGSKVFFANSGAEANEAALKLARRYQAVVRGAPQRIAFISTQGSFHGRSIATVAVTGQEKYRQDFGPLFGPVHFVPFGELAQAEAVLKQTEACAFILEPIQGDGGVLPAPPGYLAGLRALTAQYGALLLLDEVQTGMGRTGRWFGHHWSEIEPDIMTLAKGLGGGVATAAVVTTDEIAQGLAHPGDGPAPHATTFGGNPLSCAAILAVIETIEQEGLLNHANEMAEYLQGRLNDLVARRNEQCEGVRGQGLLQGLVLNQAAAPTVDWCRQHGLLLGSVAGNVIRFSPPLVVQRGHLDEAVDILEQALAH